MSTNPGATISPLALIVLFAVALAGAKPTSVIRSPLMPISAKNHGLPEPVYYRLFLYQYVVILREQWNGGEKS